MLRRALMWLGIIFLTIIWGMAALWATILLMAELYRRG